MSNKNLRPVSIFALVAVFLLGVFGVGAGVYMTWHHELSVYGPEGAIVEIVGCVESAHVSCDVVNTSEWSELFGVPQFTWAIPTYITFAFLGLFGLKDRSVGKLILGMAILCGIYSLFLAYISKVELGTWCTWCIRLYVTNALLIGMGGLAALKAPNPSNTVLKATLAVFLASTVGAVGAQRAYRSSLLGDAPVLENLPDTPKESTGDPKGDAPTLSWTVTTEDKTQATLTTSPDDAWKGNPESKVAVVEFGDFECGYCKRTAGELKRLYDIYGDRVLFVFKHFPMDPACNPGVKNRKHRYACQAAMASVCVQEQGYFWKFHDLAFKNQHQLKPADLITYAKKAGADEDLFKQCMRSRGGEAKVRADATKGKELGQHGTPRIWVNGKLYRAGQSAEQMARALELALGATAADAQKSAMVMRDKRDPIEPIPENVPDMRKITLSDGHSYEIDTFEAALENGKATVGKHLIPGTRMSWFAANDACKAAGKRLCTEKEWVGACQGATPVDDDGDGEFADDMVEGTTYPYGDYHDPRRCWSAKDRNTMRPVYTGEMPGCVSKDGVYDLTGNVEEWVGSTKETSVLLGGAFDTGKDHARCFRRNNTFGPGYANKRTGFRCCR